MNESARTAAGEARYPDLPYPGFKRHFTPFTGVGDNGHLWIEGRDCVELAETFGTPLYVVSENLFRHNYRRFRDAFRTRYPRVDILFANKSNNGLAIRRIMNQEGAGGDCFGENELYLALLAGTDPSTLVLNGSDKTPAEIALAVENGVCINLDAMDELDIVLDTVRRLGRPIRIGIRLKLELKALENRYGSTLHGSGSLAEQGRAHKWGMTLPQTIELARRIAAVPELLTYEEIHYHLGRLSNSVDDFAEMAREMIRWSKAIEEAAGVRTPVVDLGGGWAFGRPERTGPDGADGPDTPTCEQYADAVCAAVRDECAGLGMDLPHLKIEPGRAIAAPTTMTLGRVGAVKEWPGYKKWVHVDCSTNHVLRIFTSHWYHHIVAANKADAACTETVDVVGPLCCPDDLGSGRSLPPLARGDLCALLDTGSYAESTVASFNAQGRPATVLVNGEGAEVITERQSLSDVVGRYRVPAYLMGERRA